MKSFETRPPDFPRPSSSVPKNMLQDRLKRMSASKAAGSAIKNDERSSTTDGTFHQQSRMLTSASVATTGVGTLSGLVKQAGNESKSILNRSHSQMPKMFDSEGFEKVADAIVLGESEFCYLATDRENPFKFYVTGVPNSIMSDKYNTLSKRGIVRQSENGDIEYVPLQRFLREHNKYHYLLRLNVFKQFRLW